MIKKIFLFVAFFCSFFELLEAQSIPATVTGRVGRFNSCTTGGAPVVTVTRISGDGSEVINGALVCLNFDDSTLLDITFSNLRWDQGTTHSWLHGLSFASNIRIVSSTLVSPWIFKSSGCTSPNCAGDALNSPGYYYASTSSSTNCCFNGGNTPDPCDNWGDANPACNVSFSVGFRIMIKNNYINPLQTLIKLRATSDWTSGCWSVADNIFTNSVTLQFNSVNCNPDPGFCNPIGTASLTTNLSGSIYQWELSTDSINYTNISDNANYTGTNSNSLTFTGIPSAWAGYRYRCVVNGINGQIHTLKFKNTWNGSVNADWFNPGNWSCNTVPDQFTDVFIFNGTIVLNASTTIHSLTLDDPATLTINTGVNLNIIHQ